MYPQAVPPASPPASATPAWRLTRVLERGEPAPDDAVHPAVTVPACRPDVRSCRRTGCAPGGGRVAEGGRADASAL